MKLIADGGSTKTDWRLVSNEKSIHTIQTSGINPFHLSEDEIDAILKKMELPGEVTDITSVYFYGAGVLGDRAINKLQSAFTRRFGSDTDIFFGDDLLAAARALFKDKKGIACIMGTGSNSGLYINGFIETKIPSLGYVLGDEGSGTDLGKRFINALFKKAIPEDLSKEILEKYKLNMPDVLQNVYRNEMPAKYLASFTKIIKEYIDQEAIKTLVEDAFNDFFRKNIARYDEFEKYDVGFVGSIAYYFEDILTRIAKKYGIGTLRILCSPMDELVRYHK